MTTRFMTIRKFLTEHSELGVSEHWLRNEIRKGTVKGLTSGNRFYVDSIALLQRLGVMNDD